MYPQGVTIAAATITPVVSAVDNLTITALASPAGNLPTVSDSAGSDIAFGTATPFVFSAGAIGSPCLFTCPITLLGNAGTISANVAVTDSVGNTITAAILAGTAYANATATASK